MRSPLRVKGLGVGVWGSWIGVKGAGFTLDLGFRVWTLGSGLMGAVLGGLGFGRQSSGFGVQD